MGSAAPRPRPARHDAPDPELLTRVSNGDVSALGLLYDRHARDLRRVLVRLGVTPADVEDALQETFLDVVRCAQSYDGRPDARPWLIGVAVIRVRRRRRSLRVLLRSLAARSREPAPPGPPTPEESVDGARSVERALRALDRLSSKKREVFALVVMEGLSGEQAAALLGIPVATVWTRLHHARRELRAALEER